MTAEQLLSISYRPGLGAACALGELLVVSPESVLSWWSRLRAAIFVLLPARVCVLLHARQARRHPKVDLPGGIFWADIRHQRAGHPVLGDRQ